MAAMGNGGAAVSLLTLQQLLQHTYSGHKASRQNAEKQILEVELAPGTVALLLQLVTMDQQVALPIRQAAALRLKHCIKNRWRTPKKRRNQQFVFIADADRHVVRDNLLEAIIVQPHPLIRVQLLQCLRAVVREDFPQQWPNFFQSIMNNLQSGDDTRVLGGLLALKAIYRRYQFTMVKKRGPMVQVVNLTYPLFIQMMRAFLDISEQAAVGNVVSASAPPPQAASAHAGLRAVTRMLHMSMQMSMYDIACDPTIFAQFVQLLLRLLRLPISPREGPTTERLEAVIASPLCKAKKWAARTLFSVFQRYGTHQHTQRRSRKDKAFSHLFTKTYASPLTAFFLSLFQARCKGELYLSPRVVDIALKYLEIAVEYSDPYTTVLRPHNAFLIEHVLLAEMQLKLADIELRAQNPRQYIISGLDAEAEVVAPDHAAVNCLLNLVRVRTDDVLQMALGLFANALNEYAQHINTISARADAGDAAAVQQVLKMQVRKDGVLRAVGSLSQLLLGAPALHPSIEEMLIQHVLPEFGNPQGILRSRAVWVISRFSRMRLWRNPQALATVMERVVSALMDQDVGVQIEAAFTIPILLSDHGDDFLPFIRQNLRVVLHRFFSLYDEIGACEIVISIGDLVARIGDEIKPYAVDIVRRLSAEFLRALGEEGDGVVPGSGFNRDAEDDDDPNMGMTTVECFRAILAMVATCRTMPDFLPTLYPHIGPLLQATLSPNGIEHLESALEMLALLATPHEEDDGVAVPQPNSRPAAKRVVDEFTWQFFPMVVKAHNEFAADYIGNMMAALDSYVAYGTDFFCANEALPEMMYTLVAHALAGGYDREMEGAMAAKMFFCMLTHCRGRIDALVPKIINTTVQRLVNAQRDMIKLVLCDVLGMAAWYNPALFLHVCAQSGPAFTQQLFGAWLELVKSDGMIDSRVHSKHSAIGLASLCLALDSAPPAVAAALPQILTCALGTVGACIAHEVETEERRARRRAQGLDPEGPSDDDEDGTSERAIFADADEAARMLNIPANLDAQATDEKQLLEEESDDDDDAAEIRAMLASMNQHMLGAEIKVDEYYACPIDDVNEFVAFGDAMRALTTSDKGKQVFQAWTAVLSPDQQQALQQASALASQQQQPL